MNFDECFKKYNDTAEDAKKISAALSVLSEESKTMVLVYLSALRDKEVADKARMQEA